MIKVFASWQASCIFIVLASMNIKTTTLDSFLRPSANIGVFVGPVFVISITLMYATTMLDAIFWQYIESIGDKNRFARRKKCVIVHSIHLTWVFINIYLTGFVMEISQDINLNSKLFALLWIFFIISQSFVRQKMRSERYKS